MSLTLKGKVVLVTGAGSAIGSEIVRHFSKLGAFVVMIDGNRDLQIKVSQESGSSCLAVAGSLTKAVDVINVISQTISKYRKLDLLINCVDFFDCGSSEKETSLLQEFDRTMGSTVRAVYNIVLLAAPHLIKSRGNVVNIIHLPRTKSLAYSVALVSLEQLTKSLALDLAPNEVRVNSITFNFLEAHVAGDLKSRHVIGGNAEDKLETDSAQDKVAEGVAESVAFLVSDAALFITGASIPLTESKCPISEVDGIETTINQLKIESNVQSHKVGNTSRQAENGENSIHKGETAIVKKGKPEPIPDHKTSDSKIEKIPKHESEKKAKEDKKTDHESHGQNLNHSNNATTPGHDEANHAKLVSTGNHGTDHKLPPKIESNKNGHGKTIK